jgi:lysyl-tRNA synthetase class 2
MTAEPLMQARLEKLRRLREEGIDPYPPRFSRSHSIGEVIAGFSSLATEEHSGEQVMIAGRERENPGIFIARWPWCDGVPCAV